jgi:hypothetical protein
VSPTRKVSAIDVPPARPRASSFLGQLVPPDLADAVDERFEVDVVRCQEVRAVDVEEDEAQTATVASSADRNVAT